VARAPAALRLVADRAGRALRGTTAPPAGAGIAVAVSGGADSLALLHALRVLAGPRGWRLEVVTVDHGLRPGSAADAAFVVDHAKALGLGAHVAGLSADELRAHRAAGPEGAARAGRYRALRAVAELTGCGLVATGHTLDDQAETVLLQLLRGSGPHGMAAMAVRDGWLLRPLLGVRRAETRACCQALGLAWREDQSNADQRLLRNAVRLRALPLLEELRPGATRALARAADLARHDREWLEPLVSDALAEVVAEQGDGGSADGAVALLARGLAELPPGLGRRVVRAACVRAGCAPPAADATDRIVALASSSRAGGAVRWPGGAASRAGDLVVLARAEQHATTPAFAGGERRWVGLGSGRPARSRSSRVFEDDIESVLLTEEQVQSKVRDLAAQISKDYQGRDVLLVGVLKGAFILMADLARALTVPHEFDFMAVSSYGSATQTSGVVRILKDLDREIQGRDVLLVEDIIDSGLTLNYLLKNLRSRRPATLEVCALLYKPEQLKADIEVKYTGFDIPSVFVVGYGLDYAERYRSLPFVATLKPEVYRGRS
jgi:tRNA(Ile)-lysidine synthase